MTTVWNEPSGASSIRNGRSAAASPLRCAASAGRCSRGGLALFSGRSVRLVFDLFTRQRHERFLELCLLWRQLVQRDARFVRRIADLRRRETRHLEQARTAIGADTDAGT